MVWSHVFSTPPPNTSACCIPSSLAPPNTTAIVLIVRQGSQHVLKLCYVSEERKTIQALVDVEMPLKERPIAFTFDSVDGRLTTLCADGTWAIWRLAIKQQTATKITGEINEHLSIHLKGYDIYDSKLGALADIASLADSYVALVAPRLKTKDHAAEHVVSVWDVKYGTLQAEQVLHIGEKQTASKSLCKVRRRVRVFACIAKRPLGLCPSQLTTLGDCVFGRRIQGEEGQAVGTHEIRCRRMLLLQRAHVLDGCPGSHEAYV